MRPAPLDRRRDSDADVALMARLRRDDDRAFAALLDRHLNAVAGFAYRLLGDSTEAEDIAQETFLRLWRNRQRWMPRAQLRTWLYRVARNLCVDRHRRREVVVASMPERPDPGMGPAGRLQEQQVTEVVVHALRRLPERQQVAITLVYHEGLSNTDAADVLGVSVEAIESLLARGRRALRKDLGNIRLHLLGD